MTEYTSEFVSTDFTNSPEITREQIVINKFQSDHGVVVDETMVVPSKTEMYLMRGSVTMDVPESFAAFSGEGLSGLSMGKTPEIMSISKSYVPPMAWMKSKFKQAWSWVKGLFS